MKADMIARVSNLIKSEQEWSKHNFVPFPGEILVYTYDDLAKSPSIKIGDGKHTLHELPFVIESIANDMLEKHVHDHVLDAGDIKQYIKKYL